jgi:hypothetical protein
MEGCELVIASEPGVTVGDQDARREPFTGLPTVGRAQRPRRTGDHADPDEPENDGKHVLIEKQGKRLRYRRIGLNSQCGDAAGCVRNI